MYFFPTINISHLNEIAYKNKSKPNHSFPNKLINVRILLYRILIKLSFHRNDKIRDSSTGKNYLINK